MPANRSIRRTCLDTFRLSYRTATIFIGSLEKLGYTRFKVVNQMTYTTAVSIFPHEIGWRLLRKTRLGKMLPDGIKIDCDRVHTSHDWVFRQGCSGPFGEDTFGDWLTADRARQLYHTSACGAFSFAPAGHSRIVGTTYTPRSETQLRLPVLWGSAARCGGVSRRPARGGPRVRRSAWRCPTSEQAY